MSRNNVQDYFIAKMKPTLGKKFSLISIGNNIDSFFTYFMNLQHKDEDDNVVKIQKSVDISKGKKSQIIKFDQQKQIIDDWCADSTTWIEKAKEVFTENSESTNRHIRKRQQQTQALQEGANKVKYRIKQHNQNIVSNTYSNSQTDDYDDDDMDIHSTDSIPSQMSTNEITQVDDDILEADIYATQPSPKIIETTPKANQITGRHTTTNTSNKRTKPIENVPQFTAESETVQLPNFDVPTTEADLQKLLKRVGILATTEEKPEYLKQLQDYWHEKLEVIRKEQNLLMRMQSKLGKALSVLENISEDDDVIESTPSRSTPFKTPQPKKKETRRGL